MDISIRPILPGDNKILAKIVRDTLTEFGAAYPNTVYDDPTTDGLYELFRRPDATYFVASIDEKIVGGGGIYPTSGLPDKTCELVKMYLLPEARGMGLGRKMIEKCLQVAAEKGYETVYLESMPELKQALKVYEKLGFEYLKGPLGNSGHTGCSLWMIKKLNNKNVISH